MSAVKVCILALCLSAGVLLPAARARGGQYCAGIGDAQFLSLINESFRFFHANTQRQNISMLYSAEENALVEGPQWKGWWIQNSYGPTYCALPFLQEPWLTALQNSQDFWFEHQGDGKTKDFQGAIAPDGCLVDCAWTEFFVYRQGDCEWHMHDWGLEFTAAGVVLQAELLLISRDIEAALRYLPHLERACALIESRRDAKNGLFLAGPGSNLLAPSYGGVRQPDGTFGRGYLAGLSITYLAACERMSELCKLLGELDKAAQYERAAKMTRDSLPLLLTADGYFVKSIEPDGTKHGVLGQERFGYFESSPNIDAICFRAVDDEQAARIYWKIASTPELRPHAFLITNWPSLDDTYANWGGGELGGAWVYGQWVNGGVWTTLEARAIMAYYRLGKYEDVRKSALAMKKFADRFQMDAPLTDFGAQVWFKERKTNLCYDALGVPAAVIRGLFEYIYKANTLTLVPHIPPSITEYYQLAPIRWGSKRLHISLANAGRFVRSAAINGRKLLIESRDRVTLRYDDVPEDGVLIIRTAGAGCRDDGPEFTQVGFLGDPVYATAAELSPAMAEAREELIKAWQHVRSRPASNFAKALVSEAVAAFEAYLLHLPVGSEPQTDEQAAITKDYENAAMALYNGFKKHVKQ